MNTVSEQKLWKERARFLKFCPKKIGPIGACPDKSEEPEKKTQIEEEKRETFSTKRCRVRKMWKAIQVHADLGVVCAFLSINYGNLGSQHLLDI